MIEVKCDTCGIKVRKFPCNVRRAKRHYCSQACRLTALTGCIKPPISIEERFWRQRLAHEMPTNP